MKCPVGGHHHWVAQVKWNAQLLGTIIGWPKSLGGVTEVHVRGGAKTKAGLSVYLFIRLSVYPFIRLSVYPSAHIHHDCAWLMLYAVLLMFA